MDAQSASAAIQPARDDAIEHYPVSRAVNKFENDMPMLVEPLTEPEPEEEPPPKRAKEKKQDDRQGSLF